jgi:ERCC4-related helicase
MTAGNIEDLYGQAKAMNLDNKLATSLTSFRKYFMIETNNWAGFIQRYPRKGAVEAIQRRLIENVDIYFPKEVREIRDIPVSVDPTQEQIEVRRELKKNYGYEKDGVSLTLKNALSLLVKLQQVSDGFIKDNEGNFLSIKSNKMDRLIELCAELLDAGERLLVWVGFKQTAKILSEVLPCKSTVLSGDGMFDAYGWRDGKYGVTIATVGSGMSLNDFADLRYSIFYSTSFSNINLQQAKGRTNRKSSLHSCAYYYFLGTDKFPDRHIYEMIEDNKTREEIAIQLATKVLKEKN